MSLAHLLRPEEGAEEDLEEVVALEDQGLEVSPGVAAVEDGLEADLHQPPETHGEGLEAVGEVPPTTHTEEDMDVVPVMGDLV